jgi:hypothetical protein
MGLQRKGDPIEIQIETQIETIAADWQMSSSPAACEQKGA